MCYFDAIVHLLMQQLRVGVVCDKQLQKQKSVHKQRLKAIRTRKVRPYCCYWFYCSNRKE